MAKQKTSPKKKVARPRLDPYEQLAKKLGAPILTTENSARAAKARAGRSPVPVIINKGTDKPLPPPVPVEVESLPGMNPDDPFNLAAEIPTGVDGAAPSGISSNFDEPAPGEPLSPEAEAALHDLPAAIGAETDEPEPGAPGVNDAGALIPSISFNEVKTRKYLVETFDWLAERFDSAHWKLTDNQADMLAGPTAELLGGIWTKLSVVLPDALTSMPGATAFLFAVSFVVVPKAAQQMALSKARRTGQNMQPKRPGPVPVPRRPVQPMAAEEIPTAGDSDFQVTGD